MLRNTLAWNQGEASVVSIADKGQHVLHLAVHQWDVAGVVGKAHRSLGTDVSRSGGEEHEGRIARDDGFHLQGCGQVRRGLHEDRSVAIAWQHGPDGNRTIEEHLALEVVNVALDSLVLASCRICTAGAVARNRGDSIGVHRCGVCEESSSKGRPDVRCEKIHSAICRGVGPAPTESFKLPADVEKPLVLCSGKRRITLHDKVVQCSSIILLLARIVD